MRTTVGLSNSPLWSFLFSTVAGIPADYFLLHEEKSYELNWRENMKDKNITAYSPSFFEWLALLFIGLRLAGVIAWPWLWVLAPLWLPVCLVIIIACVFVLCGK
jgi:hypothetical protein